MGGIVSAFWLKQGGLPHLLISKWHWVQKCKFKLFGWGACLCHLISRWHSVQKPMFQLFGWGVVSAFWLKQGGCLHLLISKWYWVQKPKFQLFGWGLFPPFDQQVTQTPKTQVPTLDVVVSLPSWRTPAAFRRCLCLDGEHLLKLLQMSLPFDQQVTLVPKTQVPTLDVVVSLPSWRTPAAFRRCLCLDGEHLLKLLQMSLPFDQQVTLTLQKPKSQL